MTDSTGKAARLEEERFHDLVHNVNSDGLQGMAWPGRRKSKAEQSDSDKAPKEYGGNVKGSIGHDKGIDCKGQNTKEKHSKTSAKGDKTDKKPKSEQEVSQNTGKDKEKAALALHQSQPIEGEWKQFCQNFKAYKARKVKTKRVAVFLPDSIWNTYQTVHSRDTSAAISVILEMFIERNKKNMKESITLKSTLL